MHYDNRDEFYTTDLRVIQCSSIYENAGIIAFSVGGPREDERKEDVVLVKGLPRSPLVVTSEGGMLRQ